MIYTITMFCAIKPHMSERGLEADYRESRSVGYYLDKDKALNAILENRGDIQERLFEYAVLESIPEGVYPITTDDNEMWFKWDEEKRAFKPSEKPADLAREHGFSIG